MHPLHPTLPPFDKVSSLKYVKKDVGREYRIRAKTLVFICRIFVQAGKQTLSSCDELRRYHSQIMPILGPVQLFRKCATGR
jgi:hypothetical protein